MHPTDNPYASPGSEVNGVKVQPTPHDKIEVTYSSTYFDMAWDRIGLYWRNPVFIALFVILAIALPLHDSFDDMGKFHAGYFFSALGMMVLLLFGVGTVLNLILIAFSATRGSAEAVFGPFRVELSDEGVTRETGTERLLIKWRGLRAVRMNAWYIRIYQTPSSYILLPRRAFVLEHDAENLYRTAKHYLEMTKPAKPLGGQDAR